MMTLAHPWLLLLILVPPVLRLLKGVVEACRAVDKPLTLCGEIQDVLRERKRDALTAYLLAQAMPDHAPTEKWENANDLYACSEIRDVASLLELAVNNVDFASALPGQQFNFPLVDERRRCVVLERREVSRSRQPGFEQCIDLAGMPGPGIGPESPGPPAVRAEATPARYDGYAGAVRRRDRGRCRLDHDRLQRDWRRSADR